MFLSIEYPSSPSLAFTCTVTAKQLACSGNSVLLLWPLLREVTKIVLHATHVEAEHRPGVHLHLLSGRIRIRSKVLKGNPQRAQLFAQQLQTYTGITQVCTNAITGSALVLYDPAHVQQEQVLALLYTVGQLPELCPCSLSMVTSVPLPVQLSVGHRFFSTVVGTAVDFAAQRVALALL
jgi:hypothetical protein